MGDQASSAERGGAGVGPGAGNVARRGVEELAQGRHAPALESFDRALAMEPGNVGIAYLRAVTLVQLGRLPEALAQAKRCLELEPQFYPALELVVRLQPEGLARTVDLSPPPAPPATARGERPALDETRPLPDSEARAAELDARAGKETAGGKLPRGQDGALPTIDPGTYQVSREFARGGMGRILEARQRSLQRPVALKELVRLSPQYTARFLREAFITARLQHPAIVPIYEAGLWPGGAPFYAMKLVKGRALDEVIRASGGLEQRLALLPNVIAVAEAVAYAHSQRIIHRDLKPANVLVGDFGETVVIDWGIAKDLDSNDPDGGQAEGGQDRDSRGRADTGPASAAETAAGTVMGTPAFMPPEQALGEAVDERADVYALGAVLYNVLSGTVPYDDDGGSTARLLMDVARNRVVPLERRVPEVPGELGDIVRKAMARDRGDRYPTARELVEDLKRYTRGQMIRAHQYSPRELLWRWIRSHRTALATGTASLALAVLVALGLSSWDQNRTRVALFTSLTWERGVPRGLAR